MADRTLHVVTEISAPLLDERRITTTLRIERSASGAPGIFVVIEDNSEDATHACVFVPDAWMLVRDITDWLANA